MTPNPLVSVVIAAYKADHYLELALQDALKQTYRNLEVIISDDAGSPETQAIVAKLGDPRLIYRANPERLGACNNHRAAINAARGEFVAILNHDDRWEPTFLETLLKPFIADSMVAVAFCDHWIIDTDGQRLGPSTDTNTTKWKRDRMPPGKQASPAQLVVDQSIPMAMGAVFRRSALNLDHLPVDAGPAYDLWLTYLLTRSGAAWYTPERLTSWRVHPNNLTSAGGADWTIGALRCWEAMAADPAYATSLPAIRRHLVLGYRSLGTNYLRNGSRSAARAAVARGIRLRPTDLKSWIVFGLTIAPRLLITRLVGGSR